MELVSEADTVPDNSYSYAKRVGNRRCHKCGRRGRKDVDINIVYYRSQRGKLHRHYLCEDCKKIHAGDIEKL
jgi:hypothetical protein